MLRHLAMVLCVPALCVGCLGNAIGLGGSSAPQNKQTAIESSVSHVSLQGLRLLTDDQYINTVHDLLGNDIVVDPTILPSDNESSGMVSVGNGQATLALSALQGYEVSAYLLANAALKDDAHKTAITGCPNATVDANCLALFVTSFGGRVFRRSLTADEAQRYTQLINVVAAEKNDPWSGVEHAVAAMLQSPYFLFRSEIGTPSVDPNATTVRLTDNELASRLSYLITGSMPDTALLQAAADGNLATAAGLKAQAERLLAGPKAGAGLQDFFSDYLGLGQVDHLQKDGNAYANFTPAAAVAMRRQVTQTLQYLLVDGNSDFREVFTSPVTYMNADLAPLYGVTNASSALSLAAFPAGQGRAGLLGQAGILALQAHSLDTSPTFRGRFIRTTFLCGSVPAPPANVPPLTPVASNAPQTMRQRLTAHRNNASCNSCHSLMDPLGLALEHFDAVGQYRATDHGLVIDTTGDLDGVAFTDGPSLGQAIHDRPELGACFAQQLFRFGTGRIETTADRADLASLTTAFSSSGYQFKSLLLAFIASDGFRYVPAIAAGSSP